MSLWNAVCSVLLWFSVRERLLDTRSGEFFLSQSAQSSLSLLAHISSPQNASGIQSSQSVTAKDGCWVIGVGCWWLPIGVSRWLRLSLWGRGWGRGHYLLWMLCVLFFCVILWEIERTLCKSKRLNILTGIVKIFQLPCPSLFIERPSLKKKDALLHLRTCLSCTLKTPFLEQEGYVLERYL